MTSTVDNGQDAIDFLVAQHNRINGFFDTVLSAQNPTAREEAFFEMRRLLAVHETAEEQIVHPMARRRIADGDRIVRERLDEENSATKMLAEIEDLDVNSDEFLAKTRELQKVVLAHAEHEETIEFLELSTELSDDELARMRKMITAVEAMAPTRPHPGVESATANTLVGPFASMLDRARDTLSAHF